MKTYEFKNTLFEYFNEKLLEKFPCLENKIFRERLKVNEPAYPYITMKSGERVRINKRFECYYDKDKAEKIRMQFRLPITFEVHDLRTVPSDAEQFNDEVIDYIEQFFVSNKQTHSDMHERGIIINEMLCSGVRDKSSNSLTSQEFVREIDIVFEFEDIQTIVSDLGEALDITIVPKD